jgi:hypothetical protein
MHLTTITLSTLALSVPALAQNPLYVSSGATAREFLGWSLAPHADVDGDGIRESLAFRARGAVLLRGSDGAVLREHQRAQLALEDLDGDGWSELAAAGPNSQSYFPFAESIDVISGFSGAVLANWSWNPLGTAPNTRQRLWPIRLGDVNGDGVGDVLAQESWGGVGLWSPPAVLVLSGVDGTELRRHNGPFATLPMGDVDGDGRADYFLDQSASAASEPPRLISGASGVALAIHSPTSAYAAPQLLSDLDGDGVPELVRESLGPAFRIESGASGALLHVVQGRPAYSLQYGPPEVLSADVNGDGVREIGVYELLTSTTTLRSLASGAVVARYDVLGFSVLNAGDVNGDSRDDLLFGSLYSAEARGRVLLATAPYDARIGVGFAFGSNACPCGPGANPEAGCAGEVASGAALTAWGSASLAARDLQFFASGYSVDAGLLATGFLLYSANALATPISSGAGLLALAPPRARIARITSGPISSIDAPSLAAWNGFTAGQAGYFQVWSRELSLAPNACQRPHNLSNAIAITFTP